MSESVEDFVISTREFCELAESASQYSSQELSRRLLQVLSKILGGVLQLPNIRCEVSDIEVQIHPELIKGIRKTIETKFSGLNVYRKVFDSHEDRELVESEIGDDVEDLYVELKEGLVIYDRGGSENAAAAVWHWRFGFETHWARHLIGVLQPLFQIIYGEKDQGSR